MEELKTVISYVESIGFIGLLILLAFPKTRKWLGFNGNGKYQAQIDELKTHAEVANSEMAEVKTHLGAIAEDVSFIKGVISKK